MAVFGPAMQDCSTRYLSASVYDNNIQANMSESSHCAIGWYAIWNTPQQVCTLLIHEGRNRTTHAECNATCHVPMQSLSVAPPCQTDRL